MIGDSIFKLKFLRWVVSQLSMAPFHFSLTGAISAFIKEESFEAKSGAAATFPVFGKVDFVIFIPTPFFLNSKSSEILKMCCELILPFEICLCYTPWTWKIHILNFEPKIIGGLVQMIVLFNLGDCLSSSR